jgi:hypothetical protein
MKHYLAVTGMLTLSLLIGANWLAGNWTTGTALLVSTLSLLESVYHHSR